MTSVEKLQADCKRSRSSKRFSTVENYEGIARFYKTPTPPSRASLDLRRTDNPSVVEKLVLNDLGLWEYDVGAKEVCLHEIPKWLGRNGDNNLMALLFGMEAVPTGQAARYDIQLKGEDQYYFYLEIVPKLEKDKADFAKARLTLLRSTYLPAQLWFQQANQDEVTWSLTNVNPTANFVQPKDFERPPTPQGWGARSRIPAADAPLKIASRGELIGRPISGVPQGCRRWPPSKRLGPVFARAFSAFPNCPILSQPTAVPANHLDLIIQILENWERALKDVTAFKADSPEANPKVFESTEIREGRLRILKTSATLYASLELSRKEMPGQIVEKLLLNERGFCEYDFAAKEVRVHPLSVRPDRADNPIGFLFGVKAQDLKARFELHFGPADPNFFLIDIVPQTVRDKSDFARARLALMRTTYMPAQLWFQQVNQDQTQWDFTRINEKANHLRPADFAASPTSGWKLTAIPAVTAK